MTDSNHDAYFEYLIIGGGIAGVVCAETLCELISPSKFAGAHPTSLPTESLDRVAIISASHTVKTTINLRRITNLIEAFDVEETPGDRLAEAWPTILSIIFDTVLKIDPLQHHVYLSSRGEKNPIRYGRLCIATGGVPRLIDSSNPLVIGLRDTESIQTFQNRLRGTRRLILVGNGGIATEIAYEVTGCQIIWAIKDTSISAPFLDPAAAKFLLDSIDLRRRQQQQQQQQQQPDNTGMDNGSGDHGGQMQIRRMRYVIEQGESNGSTSVQSLNLIPFDRNNSAGNGQCNDGVMGSALGPDWAHGRDLRGQLENPTNDRLLKVVSEVRVRRILSAQEMHDLNYAGLVEPFENQSLPNSPNPQWPVYVELTNNQIYGCDLIVSAIGIDATSLPSRPNKNEVNRSEFFGTSFDRAPAQAGNGLLVNDQMQTSVPDIYAAGDCAYANWTWSPHWFQMRLWNQARQMAFQAAKCMNGHRNGTNYVPLDFSFEIFTHVTYFFGFKVVLLGLFNGQGLDLTSPDCYLLMRVTPGQEYIKCVMKSGRMQGALLIGETDLEETLENLIVNQLDLTNLEDRLLDPDVDLSDYFD